MRSQPVSTAPRFCNASVVLRSYAIILVAIFRKRSPSKWHSWPSSLHQRKRGRQGFDQLRALKLICRLSPAAIVCVSLGSSCTAALSSSQIDDLPAIVTRSFQLEWATVTARRVADISPGERCFASGRRPVARASIRPTSNETMTAARIGDVQVT